MIRPTTILVLLALVPPTAMMHGGASAGDEKTAEPAADNLSPAAAELLKAFKGKKWTWERVAVGDEIVKLGDKSLVPAMAELLASDDRHLRCNAGAVLVGLGDERGLEAVIRELRDLGPRPVLGGGPIGFPTLHGQIVSDRQYAAWTLGRVGDRRAVPALIPMLNDESIDYEAAIALGDLGDERAVPALQEFLKTAPAAKKFWAGRGLAKLGDPLGLPTVIGFLKDPQWVQRRHAVDVLRHFHDKAVVAALIEATKDESADVRVTVVRALGEIGNRSAVPALEALKDDDAVNTSGPPIQVREAAAKALEQIAAATEDGPKKQEPASEKGATNEKLPDWSQAIAGLEFRLIAARTEFQAWELPTFVVEARNTGDKAVTNQTIEQIVDSAAHSGWRFLFRGLDKQSPAGPNRRLMPNVRLDMTQFVGLKPGETKTETATLAATREQHPYINIASESYALAAGRYAIGLGVIGPRQGAEMKTNDVTLTVLPPGVRDRKELKRFVKPYSAGQIGILAGFVPNKTTLVEGEPILATFMIENPGDEPFLYEFGGDYRGVGRHNRFVIDVIRSDGGQAEDPSPQGDMGGISGPRSAEEHDAAVETVDLLKYRRIVAPGKYKVTCRFDLTPWRNDRKKNDFKVPVENTYELTILPREPGNVERALSDYFAEANQTGALALDGRIEIIAAFGRELAVPGLTTMGADGDVEHRVAAARGLGKIAAPSAVAALLKIERDPVVEVRTAAIASLGSFTEDSAVDAVVQALIDPNEEIRKTAAVALGQMKTDTSIEALIGRLPKADPEVGAAILRGMGASKSPRVFAFIVESLASKNDMIRRAALDAMVNFPPGDVAGVLRPYAASDADMNFREMVVQTLAERLHEPIEMNWLTPVIKSRNVSKRPHVSTDADKANPDATMKKMMESMLPTSIGDAPRLMRLHGGEQAVPALLSCLDFENPAVRSYYNGSIVEGQVSCRGALAIPWHKDLNRDGTPAETEENRQTLARLKSWLEYYQTHAIQEEPRPRDMKPADQEPTWGEWADDLRVRAQVNRSVWPEGLPQVITFDADGRSAGGGGTVFFTARPEVLEVEVNDQWYELAKDAKVTVCGDWNAYRGNPLHDLQLDGRWRGKVDGLALDLIPGKYTVRVAVSRTPAGKRKGLAISKPVKFEVIAVP